MEEVSEHQKVSQNAIALLIDDVVVDVIYTDNRLAAILLSEPQIIDVTDYADLNGVNITVMPGMRFNKEDSMFYYVQESSS